MINTIVFDFFNVLVFSNGHQFELNYPLFDYIQTVKAKYQVYLFTAGTLYQKPEFQQHLDKNFIKIFTEAHLGFLKSDPQAYRSLSQHIQTPVSEIIFIDDKIENIEASNQAGLHAIQYLSNDQLLNEFVKMRVAELMNTA